MKRGNAIATNNLVILISFTLILILLLASRNTLFRQARAFDLSSNAHKADQSAGAFSRRLVEPLVGTSPFSPLTLSPLTFLPLTFLPLTFLPLTFLPLTFLPLTFLPLT
jgi:hypothetical protein